MKAVEFIRMLLDVSLRTTLDLIQDMKDQPLTFPTSRGGNHPLWVLGHLAWAEGNVIQQVMLGRPNPVAHWKELFGIGSEALPDPSRYATLDELHGALQSIRGETLKVLDTLTDDDLDQASKGCPPEFAAVQGTYAQCFRVVIFNTLHHRGQVADARRAAGRKPLRR